MVCALNVNHRNGLASAQVAPTDDMILPRIPLYADAHDSHATSSHPSLCRGHNKVLSLFRSVAYLPLVQKLFNVVKVVFVVLKIYSISACAGRCCTIVPFLRERFHPVYIGLHSRRTPLNKSDNVYTKTGVIFNFKIFWPKYAKIRRFL